MDSVKVKAFLKAVEYGSLTRAAEELGYTQAGLTHMMNRFENELGVTVLKRSKNGVSLTPDGEKLFPYFQNFLISSEQLNKIIDEVANKSSEVIRIGAYTSILKMWIPYLINSFRETHPDLRIEVRDSNIDTIYNWIYNNEIDIAFASRRKAENCRFIPLKKDSFFAVVPKDEKINDNSPLLNIQYFNSKNFIMPTFGYDPDILSALHNNNVHPVINQTSVGDASVAALVEIGQGYSILPELVLKSIDTGSVKYKKLTPECHRELGIILPEGKIKSPLVRSFVEHSEKTVKMMI